MQIWEETCHEEKDTRSALSGQSCRRFSLAEIKSATQNFNGAFLIGKGGFGKVYKGFISGGSETVAVKRLKSNSKQGAQEFWTEIETLSQIRHIHLVSPIGYCNESKEMILVYEYMPRGTLADNLYKTGGNGNDGAPLTWEQRLRVCIGAARGLDYLHTGIKFGVIHRDVKDSNILLDENRVAKISDFGLSKLGTVNESQGIVSTKVKGTFGYLDPDYFMTHKPTRKTDVYAFGVVMLVVLCGRPAVDTSIPWEPQSLLFLFRESMTKGDTSEIVDPSMQGKILSESLKEFSKTVKNCLHPEPKKRPTMSQVVRSLEYALEQQQSTMSSKSEEAEVNSRIVRGAGTQMRNSSSKVPSVLIPQTPWSGGEILVSSNLKKFTFAELRSATRNFPPDSILGEGGFGPVFKGWIDEQSLWDSKPGIGTVVAVKRLNQDGMQGHREWLAEIKYLGLLRHPNLVKLVGYCLEDDHRLLVYEFMAKGSLENHLYSMDSNFQPLSWRLRIKIALEAARVLAFLHGVETKIIHRDFKTSNILLDLNYNAKLSGFGLARAGPTYDSHVSTRVMGTYGYAAPEYVATGYLSAKCDVYSFGVVLLEILTGKRPFDTNRPTGEHNLVDWAKPYLTNQRRIFRVLDARLEGQCSLGRAFKLAKIALRCLSAEPKLRPTMDEVVTALEQVHDKKG